MKLGGRSDGAHFDVAELDGGAGLLLLDVRRHARAGRARSARHARLAGVAVGREVAVEPEHVGVVVVPQRHDEHHAALHGLAHLAQAALDLVVVDVAEQVLGGRAELVRDRVVRAQSGEVDLRAIDIESAPLL